MAQFLSDEWVRGLDEAISSDDRVREAAADASLVVQQTVTGAPQGDVSWHVVVDHGTARVGAGPAEAPDVTFTQDHATAVAVGRGELSAQAAFMLGKLRVGGDVTRLMEQRDVFEGLDDVFGEVRRATTY